jgi:hypothetical protein
MMASEKKFPVVNIAGRLVINGRTLPVGQIFEHSLVMLEPCDMPATEATLIVTVSGQDKVYNIFLPHGLSRDSEVAGFF